MVLGLRGQDGIRIDQTAVFALLDRVGHVDSVLLLHQSNQLIGIFADDHGTEMTSDVVPSNTISVLVVQHGEASLVVIFLKIFNGHSNVEFGIDGTFLDTFIVIGLGSSIPVM